MKQLLSLLIAAAFALVPAQAVLAQGGRPDVSARREQAQARATEARAKAQERVVQIKQEVEDRKTTIQQEVCERRQEKLAAVMPRLATGATSTKNALDTMYARVQGFYADGQLTVANYDELNANVAAAKADAETVLAAVETYEFELDCENPNVGEQLDGFRSSVTEARESLKAYRTQLVALISAMRAEAAEQAENNAGSDTEGATENEQAVEGAENE